MRSETIVIDRLGTLCSAVFGSGVARGRPTARSRHSAALLPTGHGFIAGFGPEPESALAAARFCPLPPRPWPRWPATPVDPAAHPQGSFLNAAAADPAGLAAELLAAAPPLGGLIGELRVSLEDVRISRTHDEIHYQTGSVEVTLHHPLSEVPAPLTRVTSTSERVLQGRIGLAAAALVTDPTDAPHPAPVLVGEAERMMLDFLSQRRGGECSARLIDDPTAADAVRWRPCDDLGDATNRHDVRDAVDMDGVPQVPGITSLTNEQLVADFQSLQLEGSQHRGGLEEAMVVSSLLPMTDAPSDGNMTFAVGEAWDFRTRRWSPVRGALAITLHLEDLILERRPLVGLPGLSALVVSRAEVWERNSNGQTGRHHAHS